MSDKAHKVSLLVVAVCVAVSAGCGAGLTDDISDTAPQSASCNAASYPDTMGYTARLQKYKNDTQCWTQVQAAEVYRQNAITNCSAGNMTNAAAQYENYKKSVKVVNSYCP